MGPDEGGSHQQGPVLIRVHVAAGYLWRFFNPGGLDRQRLRHALSSAVLHVFLPVMIFTVGLALDFKDIRRIGIALPALAIKLFAARRDFE